MSERRRIEKTAESTPEPKYVVGAVVLTGLNRSGPYEWEIIKDLGLVKRWPTAEDSPVVQAYKARPRGVGEDVTLFDTDIDGIAL